MHWARSRSSGSCASRLSN